MTRFVSTLVITITMMAAPAAAANHPGGVRVHMDPDWEPTDMDYTPRPFEPRQYEAGVNLRLALASTGQLGDSTKSAPLFNVGGGVRFKPIPYLALEAGIDYFVVQHDQNDFAHAETMASLTGLVYVNPYNRGQIYFVAGMGWRWVNVTNDQSLPGVVPPDATASSRYLVGQTGAGFEYRFGRFFALGVDLRVFGGFRASADSWSTAPSTIGGILLGGNSSVYF